MRLVLLDNEAVQALIDPGHRKHRSVAAHLPGVLARRRKGEPVTTAVPTAVRVEAGWDRTEPAAAAVNRLRILDLPLDAPVANLAAAIVTRSGVTVTDAHLGAAARTSPAADVVVLTSDPADIVRAAAPRTVTVVRI